MKCKQCGWVNQAGQTTCTWCQAPLELEEGKQHSVDAPFIPGPPAPDDTPFQAHSTSPPTGYFLGADGMYYPRTPAPYTPSQARSAWIAAGWIAFFVFVVPFVLLGGALALCIAATGAGGSGSSGGPQAAAAPIILIIVGGLAVLLLVIFSSRKTR